ncbi:MULTISPECIES: helix-turn-helix domain-containing protein [unclassified Pseudonocardia]|uniref:helix-turn-helix domain-containing protein n=1 Tax=unclassified Pseudonocardia TaxID=2619320 RepID=UPI00094B182E|nr:MULTISPECIES: helix-turn-helix domain-containing protein [unclassified Pseudonocardia]
MTDRPKPDPDAEWWTSTDVAAYLGVQLKTVSAYRHRKQMPEPDNRIGQSWIWKPARIIEWHNEPGRRRKTRGGTSPAGPGEGPPAP